MTHISRFFRRVRHRATPPTSLQVIDEGVGDPVVLLHGLGTLGAEVAAPLDSLRSDFRLLAPDRPGYGLSALAIGDDPRWFGRMLRARHVRRPVVVAHSIGAVTALRYALKHPAKLAGLVLVAPFCRPTEAAAMPLLRLAVAPVIGGTVRRHILPQLLARLAPAHIAAVFAPEPVSQSFGTFPLEMVARPDAPLAMARDLRGFNANADWIGTHARRLSSPTIILSGTEDPIIDSEAHAAWLAQRAPGVTVLKVEGGGHMLHHTHPNLVTNAVRMLARRDAREHFTYPRSVNQNCRERLGVPSLI